MILTVAQRELKSLFVSRLAWSILAIQAFIMAYIFLLYMEDYMQIQAKLAALEQPIGATSLVVGQVLGSTGIVLMIIVPVITMRVICDERRLRSFRLLLTAPLASWQIVLGKYLGVLVYLFALLAVILAMIGTLAVGTSLDWGLVASGILGVTLVLASFCAVGILFSAWCEHPAVAAVATFTTLFFFWIIHWVPQEDALQFNLFEYLSLQSHYQNFLRGIVDSRDVAFFLLLILTCLTLATWRVARLRQSGG